jgi:hypothetical protein
MFSNDPYKASNSCLDNFLDGIFLDIEFDTKVFLDIEFDLNDPNTLCLSTMLVLVAMCIYIT